MIMEFERKRGKGRSGRSKGVEVEEGRREWDTGGLEKPSITKQI